MEVSVGFTSMLFRPTETLEGLKERPHWFYPLLAAAAYTMAVNLYVVWRVGMVRLVSAALRANEALDPQSVLSAAMQRKTQILLFQGISGLLSVFVTSLIVAKVLWLVLQVIGDDVPFRRVLAVVAHAAMLTVFLRHSMLALAATVMPDPDNFNLANPLATNLAFFLHPGSQLAQRLLSALDLLTFANIFLIALGLSKVSDCLTLRRSCVLVSVPWAIYTGALLFVPFPRA